MDFIGPFLQGAAKHRHHTGCPFVTLSYAQSLDGCISGRPGESLALSGRESLKLTHKLRATHDAILVGIGTVLSDNPRLNVRLVNGTSPRPIIVDSSLRIPMDSKLLKQDARSPWIVTKLQPDTSRVEALKAVGAVVLPVPSDSAGRIDLNAMLLRLGELGVNSLMVEGGSRIITSFLFGRLADFIVLTVAPVLVGGLRAVSDLGWSDSQSVLRLGNLKHRRLGEDLILWGHLS
jgi:riboflavin-specific deaminase-like protein